MRPRRKGKTLLITLLVLALLAAAGAGTWYFLQNRNTEPVNVYAFQFLGMTEYWGDSQESYGPVSTDKIQTVFLTETQTITDIHVQMGDTVKKGDLLLSYDTTLSDLSLERERLAVEKLKLQLDDAQAKLKEIKNMKPMVIPEATEPTPPKVDNGKPLGADYKITANAAHDGSSPDKALICWVKTGLTVDDALLEKLRLEAELLQKPEEIPTEPTEVTTEPAEETEPTEETTKPTEETDPTQETTESTEETTEPTQETTEETIPWTLTEFFVIFKSTSQDMTLTPTTLWQGMQVQKQTDNTFRFQFFDASYITDPTRPKEEPLPPPPTIDMGSGYTSAQIAEMRAQQEKTIKDLKFQVKMAEVNYKIKQTEAESGQILATVDGTVVSVLSEEEAKQTGQPILKISGGGGFYVRGSVSELEKDKLQLGQEVTINDWNTGNMLTGTIQSVADYPTTDGSWNGMGNPNVSYYPFMVFVDGDANLQEGSYVSIQYAAANAQQGIYLENPYLRTEDGKSYVYVRGADGKLEKRFVTTGKSLWGNYTQILEGLTAEDFLAFPYGKNVKAGAETKESDISELYK